MSRLDSCRACQGFVPFIAQACPHCGAARSNLMRRVIGASAGGAVAMTLMACYGGPTGPDPAGKVAPSGSTTAQKAAPSTTTTAEPAASGKPAMSAAPAKSAEPASPK